MALALSIFDQGSLFIGTERLTEVLEMEREAPREFQPLPFHYVEIAKLLLDK